jgi:hypothetical protein
MSKQGVCFTSHRLAIGDNFDMLCFNSGFNFQGFYL